MFLDERMNFRLRDDEIKLMRKICKKARDDEGEKLYDNESHFCRVAVIKLIHSEKDRLGKRLRE